ncbi:MAG: EF-P 5-aminopentanol modification-associated protein YfmF [Porcipelethomonas sp.]
MPHYSRKNIADGIGYSTIIDPKFKTNKIQIMFITELKEETASDNAMAIGIISSSNSKYKNLSVLSDRLNELYGANISDSTTKQGDIQRLSISVSAIDDRYALENENISSEILEILMDCIFSPNASDGKFADEPFNFRKKDLLDTIDSEINNKRSYAVIRAGKEAYKGENSQNSPYGTREDAEAVTPASAYEAYKNLLKTAQIEIFFAGPESNDFVERTITKRFTDIERKPLNYRFISPSPLKNKVSRIEEKLDVKQCKMVMAFKTNCNDEYVMKFVNTILGATAISKLFINVREKKSLCYYCSSGYNPLKQTMFIDCGIEEKNIAEAEKEIMNQIDEMKKGNITDEEINHALLSLKNSLKGIGDTLSSYIGWYFGGYIKNQIIEPAEAIEKYSAVTKQQLIDAAKTLELDTVYVMKGEEDNGN